MGLLHDNMLECTECGHHEFIAEERLIFHKAVKERFYEHEKEKPLAHLQKIIVYKCAKCKHELDK